LILEGVVDVLPRQNRTLTSLPPNPKTVSGRESRKKRGLKLV